MSAAEICVCIPCFNASDHVHRVIECLEAQRFKRFTVVFVDDCSTDDTVAILTERLRKSPLQSSIQVHESNSGGMGAAVRSTMLSCELPYFTWFGVDDELEPEYFEALYSALTSSPETDYAYCDFAIIDAESRVTGRWSWNPVSYEKLVNHVERTTSGILPDEWDSPNELCSRKGLAIRTSEGRKPFERYCERHELHGRRDDLHLCEEAAFQI